MAEHHNRPALMCSYVESWSVKRCMTLYFASTVILNVCTVSIHL